MTAPRLEIDLQKLLHNATTLIARLSDRNISVTAITKAMLGAPELARVLLQAGASGLGDSRIENIETMREAGISARITLIRSPMLSQAKRVVTHADVSFNSELDVIRSLSLAAQEQNVTHGIVLMVELGDLREGIMPCDVASVVKKVLRYPNIALLGIGANLACRNGVSPDDTNMTLLSATADSIEAMFNIKLKVVTGGNSANLNWTLDGDKPTRINDLRLGESILLGREPLHRQPIEGLHTDAIVSIAEAIESKIKPALPWGQIAESAFSNLPPNQTNSADNNKRISQTILAIGHQDTDPSGLQLPSGMSILGASSDHLIADAGRFAIRPGSEITMRPNYSALLRAMTSPFVAKVWKPLHTVAHRPVGHISIQHRRPTTKRFWTDGKPMKRD